DGHVGRVDVSASLPDSSAPRTVQLSTAGALAAATAHVTSSGRVSEDALAQLEGSAHNLHDPAAAGRAREALRQSAPAGAASQVPTALPTMVSRHDSADTPALGQDKDALAPAAPAPAPRPSSPSSGSTSRTSENSDNSAKKGDDSNESAVKS